MNDVNDPLLVNWLVNDVNYFRLSDHTNYLRRWLTNDSWSSLLENDLLWDVELWICSLVFLRLLMNDVLLRLALLYNI